MNLSKSDSIETLLAKVCFQISAPERVLAFDGVVTSVPSTIGAVVLIDFFNGGRWSVDDSKSGDNRRVNSLRFQHCFLACQHRVPLR